MISSISKFSLLAVAIQLAHFAAPAAAIPLPQLGGGLGGLGGLTCGLTLGLLGSCAPAPAPGSAPPPAHAPATNGGCTPVTVTVTGPVHGTSVPTSPGGGPGGGGPGPAPTVTATNPHTAPTVPAGTVDPSSTHPHVTTTVTVTTYPSPTAISPSQCNVGDTHCCNTVQSSDSAQASKLLGLLGVVLSGVAVPVGITCSPLNIVGGVGNGGQCNAQPVCCQNNSFNGVVAIGCTPININL